ncbi:histidine phosphatase superfamily [Chiua virens]|nr:histidine phosphatase superfamily [Chiua virens]
MYLPLGSTLIGLLQIPLLRLDAYGSPARSIVPIDQCQDLHGSSRSKLNNLGNLSPYHDGPFDKDVSVNLPDDCTVDQVILLQRHGSRGPTKRDQGRISELVKLLDKEHDHIQVAELPESLQFLKKGYTSKLVAEELSIVGRKELFNLGVEFRQRYPEFSTDVAATSPVQRVMDSAHFFMQGCFGLQAKNVNLKTTDCYPDPVNWILPWNSCPKLSNSRGKGLDVADEWAKVYISDITKRLTALTGVKFTDDATRGALYACPYDLAAGNPAPWCDVFTAEEIDDFAYELDLAMDYWTGHLSKGDPGPMAGAYYVKKLIQRLKGNDAEPLYLDFGHETSILFALSALGLNKDIDPLPAYPREHRKFRTSDQTPFAANMVWEKFTCRTSFKGPQVRLLLNREIFPLSNCKNSENDRKYGTCSLDEFEKANKYSLDVEYESEVWDNTCGKPKSEYWYPL